MLQQDFNNSYILLILAEISTLRDSQLTLYSPPPITSYTHVRLYLYCLPGLIVRVECGTIRSSLQSTYPYLVFLYHVGILYTHWERSENTNIKILRHLLHARHQEVVILNFIGLTCPPDSNAPTNGNLLQKGLKSSNQGQGFGHTIEFPLYVYIVKTNRGHNPVKTDQR